jgi:proteic killer suppression protein
MVLALITKLCNFFAMIEGFACKETARLWKGEHSRRFPADIHSRTLQKLILLHSATRIENLRIPPSNRLEMLKGDRAGQYSIRINDQWRICFRWTGSHAVEVAIVDYH